MGLNGNPVETPNISLEYYVQGGQINSIPNAFSSNSQKVTGLNHSTTYFFEVRKEYTTYTDDVVSNTINAVTQTPDTRVPRISSVASYEYGKEILVNFYEDFNTLGVHNMEDFTYQWKFDNLGNVPDKESNSWKHFLLSLIHI